MKKLKNLLQSDFEFFYLAIPIVLVAALLFNFFFIIPLFIYMFYIRKYKYIKQVIFVLLVFILISVLLGKVRIIPKSYVYVYEVHDTYSLSNGYIIYDKLKKNSFYKVDGEIIELDEASVLGGFNQKKYYESKGIYYGLKPNNKTKLIYEIELLNKFETFLLKTHENNKEIQYISTLVLGNNILDEEVESVYKDLSISHLFSVSGFHIVLYANVLSLIFEKFLSKNKSNFMVSSILLLLIIISSFKISIIRASLLFILKNVFSLFKIEKSSLEILSIVVIFILFFNSSLIIDYAFILSFLSSFVIIISKKINKSVFSLSLITFLVTLPIIVNLNGGVSILSVFYNVFFVTLFSSLLIPFALISFATLDVFGVFPELINFTEYTAKILNSYNYILSFKNIHILIIFIYYFFLFLIFKKRENKKNDFMSVAVLSLVFYCMNTFSFEKVVIIDVGQGSSALVSNKNNYLVDVGGSLYYDVAKYRLNPLLKFYNIKNVDVFLSHMHNDHIGSYDELKKYVNIKNTYLTIFADNEFKKDFTNIKYLKPFEKVDNFVNLYPTKEQDDENNKSLVLKYTFSNGETVLFPGDSELFDFYEKVDYLVLAHHGSNTSFNEEVLYKTNFKKGFISAGKNNFYHHPNRDVVELLNKYRKDYYITYEDKSIYIINFFGKIYVFTQKEMEYFYGIY